MARARRCNGDEIVSVLTDADLFCDAAFNAAVTAAARECDLAFVVAVGGPFSDTDSGWSWTDYDDESDAWRDLFELAATGISAADALRWRSCGYGDGRVVSALTAPGAVVAEQLRDQERGDLLDAAGVWLREFAGRDIPVSEAPGWAAAGMLTDPYDKSTYAVIARWRDRLGKDAVAFAAAGLTWHEATAAHQGGVDPARVRALAALLR